MKSFDQFKAENNISTIQLLQGKGRKYAQVRDIQLVVSKNTDLGQPLYVTPLNEAIDPTKEMSEENSRPVPNAVVLINASNVKMVEAI